MILVLQVVGQPVDRRRKQGQLCVDPARKCWSQDRGAEGHFRHRPPQETVNAAAATAAAATAKVPRLGTTGRTTAALPATAATVWPAPSPTAATAAEPFYQVLGSGWSTTATPTAAIGIQQVN